jgi:hypothetical protein
VGRLISVTIAGTCFFGKALTRSMQRMFILQAVDPAQRPTSNQGIRRFDAAAIRVIPEHSSQKRSRKLLLIRHKMPLPPHNSASWHLPLLRFGLDVASLVCHRPQSTFKNTRRSSSQAP